MKRVALPSSSSSMKSSTTTVSAAMEDHPQVSRDSSYFHGCRKDANCSCNKCLESFNATLDLKPKSNQRSSLTRFSSSKPVARSPISFSPSSSLLSTPPPPRPHTRRILRPSPGVGSTARMPFDEKKVEKKVQKKVERKVEMKAEMKIEKRVEKAEKKSREVNWGSGFSGFRLLLVLVLIFLVEFGFHSGVPRVLQPQLSDDIVRSVGEKSLLVKDLGSRLGFVQNELQGLVQGKVSICSNIDSKWELSQDGLILISRCSLYRSMKEEVSIWGYPLQTSGLLAADFSSLSFTIISGRVTEWSDGMFSLSIRNSNSSWVHKKWSASVLQLDPNTWVLEYRRSPILENSRLSLAAVEFLKFWMSKVLGSLMQRLWRMPLFRLQYSDFTSDNDFIAPT